METEFMNIVALVIKDVHLAHNLLEKALGYAKEYEAGLHAIFLVREPWNSDEKPGSIWSNSYAPNSRRVALYEEHLALIRRRTSALHIPLKITALFSPLLQQLVSLINDADRIAIELENESLFDEWSFSRSELLRRIDTKKLLHVPRTLAC